MTLLFFLIGIVAFIFIFKFCKAAIARCFFVFCVIALVALFVLPRVLNVANIGEVISMLFGK